MHGYRPAQVAPRPDRRDAITIPLTISAHPAPRLSVREAIERLEMTGGPFVFFADATGGGAMCSTTVTTATTA